MVDGFESNQIENRIGYATKIQWHKSIRYTTHIAPNINVEEKLKEAKPSLCLCSHSKDSNRGSLTSWIFRRSSQSCAICSAQANGDSPILVEASDTSPFGERYELISLLGQGGMGSVYKVKDRNLDSVFAVKVLRSDLALEQGAVKRFEQEAVAASQLTHPNLVAVYENGVTHDGEPFLVMDYVSGENLSQLMSRDGYLSASRAIEIFIQLSDAIAHAHSKGVIHRDLKPSNVLVTKTENGADFVKIVDFGIAKVLPASDKDAATLTQTGELFGSPLYMSPEQCLGDRLDLRSDIYSIGCLMYEAVTGKPPFTGSNPIKIIFKHVNEPPPPIRKPLSGHDVPIGLEAIILKCLEKSPDNRYQSAPELMHDLLLLQEGREPTCMKTGATTMTLRRRKKRLALYIAACATLVTSLAACAALWHFQGPTIINYFTPAKKEAERKPSLADNEIINDCTRQIKAHPKVAKYYVQRGQAYRSVREYQLALNDLTMAIQLEPSAESYRERAWTYNMMQKWQEAIEDCDNAIKRDPSYADAYVSRARSYCALNNWEKALQDSEKAIKLGSPNSVTYTNHALALWKTGRVDEALKNLRKSLMLDSTSYLALNMRSKIYAEIGKYDKAIEDLSAILAEKPDDFPRMAERADLYVKNKQYEEGAAEAKRLMSLSDHPWGHRVLGRAYLGMGKINEALSELEAALRQTPNDDYCLTQLGITYRTMKDYDKAIKYFNEAISRNPNFKDAYLERAEAFSKLGESDLARQDIETYREITKVKN